jgi:two-component system response regulator AtoC
MAQHTSTRHGIVVGPSPRMKAVMDYIAHIGPGDSTVLITGESGTGKELIANAIHAESARANGPFVPVSCALFSDSLIESELFGHERGAFTGAVGSRPGRFERALGGTIFLDDIDDVPLAMQVKLLRALQNRTIERLGSTEPTPIDVRVIAGTKRDLRKMVSAGTFREDLYYRLHVLSVDLPPLRERREDIPALAAHFVTKFFGRRGRKPMPLSRGVMAAFLAYDWPGNVRELENACERSAENCSCDAVGVGCLAASVLFGARPGSDQPGLRAPVAAQTGARPRPITPAERPAVQLDSHLREIETQMIRWALGESGGNKSRAAALLGVKRSTFGDRIARCGL